MDPKPLSNDSLKAVLQYMEANKRFLTTNHLPSLQTTDRVTPLTIKSLVFKPYGLEINGTNYSLRVHRQNRDDPNPAQIDEANQLGTIAHDLDQYGQEDHSAEAVVTPGDLEIEKRSQASKRSIDLARKKQKLMQMKNIRMCQEELQVGLLLGISEEKRLDLQQRIKDAHSRNSGKPSSYDISLQQTCAGGNINIERFDYSKKLPKAMKYLTTRLFGNRSHPTIVKKLVNDSDNRHTIRLPEGLKLKVNELHVYDTRIASIFRSILFNSQVDHMHLRQCQNSETALDTLTMARSLKIDSFFGYNAELLLRRLQNQELFVKVNPGIVSYPSLVGNWIENGKLAGTRYTFVFDDLDECEEVMEQIMDQHGGLTFIMRNQCKLVVSCERASSEEVDYLDDAEPWLMKLEVVE